MTLREQIAANVTQSWYPGMQVPTKWVDDMLATIQYVDDAVAGVGGASKFGAAGEDAVAAENRSFNFVGYDWDLISGNTAFGFYGASTGNRRSMFMQVESPLGNNGLAYFEILNRDTPGNQSYIDMYIEAAGGSPYSEIYHSPDDMYITNKEILIEGNVGNTGVEILEDPTTYAGSIKLRAQDALSGGASNNYIEISDPGGTGAYIDIYQESNLVTHEIYMDKDGLYFDIGSTNWIIDGLIEKAAATKTLVWDDNGYVGWKTGGANPFPLLADTGVIDYGGASVKVEMDWDDDLTNSGFFIRREGSLSYPTVDMFSIKYDGIRLWTGGIAGGGSGGACFVSDGLGSPLTLVTSTQGNYTPSGSADVNGETGQITYDASFIYVRAAAGWRRAALSTF